MIYIEGNRKMNTYARRKKQHLFRNKLLIASILGFLPFLYFAIIGYYDWTNVTANDYEIGAFFYELREPLRTTIAIVITRLADFEGQLIITVITVLLLFLFRKWKTGLWYGLTILLGSEYLNKFVKEIYQRVRPDQIEHLIEQGGYAFPSGHSMGSMIVFGGIIFILTRKIKTNWQQWLIGILFGLLILLIGVSRIYLGVHYPSDVIGGFSLGFTWITLSIALVGLPITRQEFVTKRYSFKK